MKRTYISIDIILSKWVEHYGLTIFNMQDTDERRFVYLSNEDGLCLQISIKPPKLANVCVDVWPIENMNEDFHEHYSYKIEMFQHCIFQLTDSLIARFNLSLNDHSNKWR